ncbi:MULTISPECIES: Tn3 family transposase [Paenibacillaceae]|jgi:TnpA family transposase|uniref:TnpA transposase n=8 Tax=Bacillota TaxID=1239 RepID=A0A2N5N6H5_9BACL|nr:MULTISPECIES: Tn3 family transposase [Paenibacillaceae]HCY5602908.1 Tn3 family transposase [Staphylococcus aureus]AWP25298.1 DDE transposase [Paenibacillus sp. Cedars]AWP25362.1 DDE transposase [Paenibacillus sp. Cedars]ETT32874.1 transposase [Paenibacillus sp. FSL R5-808]MBN2983834.1 Tn3 family transposase [Cohnella algarum]
MYARVRELLTPEERLHYLQIPPDLGEWELGTYFTFTQHDLEIIQQRRRDYNRLGFAVQLCVLRYLGWTLSDTKEVPVQILRHIAKQINADVESFASYGDREATKYEHLDEIRKEYGYQTFTLSEYRSLCKHLFSHAMANGNPLHLIQLALEDLRKRKIILPSMATIERAVWETRKRTEEKIFKLLSSSLTELQIAKLDRVLTTMPESSKTYLAWLREIPGTSSPDSFLKVIEKLEYLRDLQLQVDTKGIHPNRLRQLSKIGSRYEPHSFRRFNDPKKYAILVAYLLELIQDLTDLAFEIHDRQIMILLSKGRKAQEELQKQNGKSINEKVVHFADLGAALIKARSEGIDPFVALDAVMPWDQVVASVEEAKRLARPVDYDYLDLLEKKFYALRKYTPTLLKSLEFRSTKSAEPLMKAVDIIRDMNETGKRKVPEGAPLNFVSNRWQKHVYDDDGTINRHYYEMAVLTELRNYVRSGDVSIVGSRQHKDFEEYLVPKADWNGIDPNATKLAVSLSAKEYLEERIEALLQRLNWVSDHIDELDGVNLENGKLHIERLEKDVPDESRNFSLSLYELLPRIKLTDLLMEVANWTNFHEQFIHASSNRAPNEEETTILMATLMAMGTNIGLTKMAEATPSISYRQMANTAQWRLYEDAMNKAQAVLVNFHHKLALPSYWGNGTTSSSDGMRVQIGVSSLHADANPHYGTGKGATIYRFVSDQFSTFYTKVINTNARDAVHVIDGLLHHETDLSIEEHYTDTAGYTDQVFGLTHLLGFRFAPRLRDLADSKLYAIGKPSIFPKLEKLLRGQINTKIIQENYDDVLRLAHSIREGTVSASLIMGKIGSYARQNSLATALREMGRIEKTIFILDYLSSEALRRKIHRGLNKGEAMNALARAIFFGKHGELRERALQDQLQRASALNIIINAISVWNTVYLQQATEHRKKQGKLQEELLNHISPLGWEHINFLGEYKFNFKQNTSLNSLRPLKQQEGE